MKMTKMLPYMLVGTAGFAVAKALQTTSEAAPNGRQLKKLAVRKTSEMAHDMGNVISSMGDNIAQKMG